MISHKHKCIFIHISKCAGSSVNKAFDIDTGDITSSNNSNLYGWNEENKIFLQHATPQELLDGNLIARDIWLSYYKFIIVRNPYDRAYSDYLWLLGDLCIHDSFENYIKRQGKFKNRLTNKDISYRGDHLNAQKDYFFLDGDLIQYDRVIRFEDLHKGLKKVVQDLNLSTDFFKIWDNVNSTKEYDHYSHFYNRKRRKMVENYYLKDLEFLGYNFENQRDLDFHLKRVFNYFK